MLLKRQGIRRGDYTKCAGVLLALSLLSSHSLGESNNLIRNGDFSEYQKKEGVQWPDHWKHLRGPENVYEVGADTAVYHNAKASAYIKVLQYDSDPQHCCHFISPIENPEQYVGDTLRCAGWVKTQNMKDLPGSVQMVLVQARKSKPPEPWFEQLSWAAFSLTGGTTDWTYGSKDIPIHERANDLSIHLYVKAGMPANAVAWFDDIEVTDKKSSVSVFRYNSANPQKNISMHKGPLTVFSLDGRVVQTLQNRVNHNLLPGSIAPGLYIVKPASQSGRSIPRSLYIGSSDGN